MPRTWNRGISYGMFQQDTTLGRFVLLGITLGAVVALWAWLARATNRLVALSLGLIIGGALGNAIDRLAYGAVADFALFHIAWQDIQLFAGVNNFGVNVNGGDARSDGFEFTATANISDAWNVSLNGAVTIAVSDGHQCQLSRSKPHAIVSPSGPSGIGGVWRAERGGWDGSPVRPAIPIIRSFRS